MSRRWKEMSDMPNAQPAPAVKRAKLILGGIVGALLVGGIIVLGARSFQARALQASTEVHARQYVTIISPKAASDGLPLTLPGTLQGINEATVYARSNGYIQRWLKDIGSEVAKGELLAIIAAPEIDQELSQAIAAEQQAASGESLAKSTAERWKTLRDSDSVSQQDFDERLSSYQQAQANLASAKANTARLRNLQGFNQVVAPFKGVVTSRNIDVGDLVDAGNGGAGKTLFTIAQTDPLRLYVYVPQVYAGRVKDGDAVMVSLPEHADEEYQGTIARTARAIDVATRTMQVEIRVPNPRGALLAGAYVQASLPIKQDAGALLVPTNVLLFRPAGPRVAVVDAAGRVRLAAVSLGTDFGSSVAILSGLKPEDRIILNPADSLADGDLVIVR
jgi:RND family efflux transporter MFP subunit